MSWANRLKYVQDSVFCNHRNVSRATVSLGNKIELDGMEVERGPSVSLLILTMHLLAPYGSTCLDPRHAPDGRDR